MSIPIHLQRKKEWDTKPKLYEHYIEADARFELNRQLEGFAVVDRSDTHSIFRWLFGYQQIQVILNANSGDEQVKTYYDSCGKFVYSEMGTFGNISKITTTNYLEILKEKYPAQF